MRPLLVCCALLLAAARAQAQDSTDHAHMDHAAHHQGATPDSSFAALQQRGGRYMGVDQSRSAHRFDTLADGGRIELQSTTGDSAEVAAIRRHFRMIADQFAGGDFETPFAVHAERVPGTAVMQARRERISYRLDEVARGAALRLMTQDAEALQAIREFLAYQRREHRAPGQE